MIALIMFSFLQLGFCFRCTVDLPITLFLAALLLSPYPTHAGAWPSLYSSSLDCYNCG